MGDPFLGVKWRRLFFTIGYFPRCFGVAGLQPTISLSHCCGPVCYQLMHSFSWGSGSQGEPEAIRKRLAENQTEKASILRINLLTELLWSRKEEKEDSRQGENGREKNRKDRKTHRTTKTEHWGSFPPLSVKKKKKKRLLLWAYRFIFLLQGSQRISVLTIYHAWNRVSLFLFSQGVCQVSLVFASSYTCPSPWGSTRVVDSQATTHYFTSVLGIWTQVLALARQVLYPLLHLSSPRYVIAECVFLLLASQELIMQTK